MDFLDQTGNCLDMDQRNQSLVLLPSSKIFPSVSVESTLTHSYYSRGQMDRSGTEDLGLVARLMYGHILSNTRILSASETSFVLLAGLIPQDVSHMRFATVSFNPLSTPQVNAQLKGHIQGATHHEDATVEEIKGVREVVIKICKASGMQKLDEDAIGGWGWRKSIADL